MLQELSKGKQQLLEEIKPEIQLLIILNSKSALISTFLVLHGATQNMEQIFLLMLFCCLEAPLPGSGRERCPEPVLSIWALMSEPNFDPKRYMPFFSYWA